VSTRLHLQETLKKLDGVGRVRLCNALKDDGIVNIYIENSNREFNNSFKSIIKTYVSEVFPCHLEYDIKPYSDVLKEDIPPEVSLPAIVESLALNNPNCNNSNCRDKLSRAFPFLGEFDLSLNGLYNLELIPKAQLSTHYKQMVEFYGKELVTFGLFVTVAKP